MRTRGISAASCSTAAIIVAALMLASGGCDSRAPGGAKKFNVLCTVLPLYAIATQIVGDRADVAVELLIEPGVGCPHSYSLTVRDRRRIADADLIVAIGLGLDGFVTRGADRPDRVVETGPACDLIGDEGRTLGASAANPHVWVSPAQCVKLARAIQQALARTDPGRAAEFAANAERLIGRIETLVGEAGGLRKQVEGRKIATTGEVFDYLFRDLGLTVVASIETHEEEGMSPRALGMLVDRIKAERIGTAFVERGAGNRIAVTLKRETGVSICALDALTTAERLPLPADWYETRMRANLRAISEALAGK